MNRRHCLLYAIVSFLSFTITIILSILFYNPSSHSHVRCLIDPDLLVPSLDVQHAEDYNIDSLDEIKRLAEEAAMME